VPVHSSPSEFLPELLDETPKVEARCPLNRRSAQFFSLAKDALRGQFTGSEGSLKSLRADAWPATSCAGYVHRSASSASTDFDAGAAALRVGRAVGDSLLEVPPPSRSRIVDRRLYVL